MNYTQNYHLPQWVKSDRIMMDDFNQMCLDIENGLSSVKAESNQQAAWTGILRNGRHILTEKLGQASPNTLFSQDGITINPLANASMAATLSGARWEDYVYLGRGPALPKTILREGSTFTVILTGSQYSTKATYNFTAPLTGTIRSFDMRYQFYFDSTSSSFTGGRLSFLAEEQSGSSYTTIFQKSGITLEKSGTSFLEGSEPVAVSVPIQEGKSYRLTLHLEAGEGTSGRIGFATWIIPVTGSSTPVDESTFTVYRTPTPRTGSHSRNVSTDGAASHVLAAVRWRREVSSDKVAMSMAGKALTAAGEREVSHWDGQRCRESWFTGEGSFNGSAALKIDLSCGEDDDLRLLGYAVMFL